METDETQPEPCPASFDQMAVALSAWRKVPTLDVWATESAAPLPKWSGPRRVYGDNYRKATARVVSAPKAPLTWDEMQARLLGLDAVKW